MYIPTVLYDSNCPIRVELKLLQSCSKIMVLNSNTAGLAADFLPVAHVGWSGLNVPTAHYTGLSRQTQLGILFINSWSALFFQTIWQRFKIFHSEKVCRVTYVSYVWHKECLQPFPWNLIRVKKNHFIPTPKVLIMSLNLLQLSFAFYNIVRKVTWADSCNNLGVSWHNLA